MVDTHRLRDSPRRCQNVHPLVTQRWWRIAPVRLSLRALMIIVLVLGCGLGWIVRSAKVQRDAVAAVVQGGGRVWYDWEVPRSRILCRTVNSPLSWMRGSVKLRPGRSGYSTASGPTTSSAVKQVQVGSKDPDAVMARVAQLSRLELLGFNFDAPVSDAGIQSVRNLSALKMIAVPIRGGSLTGASLEYLTGLTGLRQVLLTTKPILSDADLVHLKGLTGLQHLQLSSSAQNSVTDAGLANIKDMIDMRSLNLRGQVTSGGLIHLRGMTRPYTLDSRDPRR